MSGDLQREQQPIDEAVVGAIVESIPSEWNGALLMLERGEHGADGEFAHTLSSLDGRRPAFPNDALFEETHKLDELFRRYGLLLNLVTYRVEELEDGSWHYRANYKHDKQAT